MSEGFLTRSETNWPALYALDLVYLLTEEGFRLETWNFGFKVKTDLITSEGKKGADQLLYG